MLSKYVVEVVFYFDFNDGDDANVIYFRVPIRKTVHEAAMQVWDL